MEEMMRKTETPSSLHHPPILHGWRRFGFVGKEEARVRFSEKTEQNF
jgi:hypothetical protein